MQHDKRVTLMDQIGMLGMKKDLIKLSLADFLFLRRHDRFVHWFEPDQHGGGRVLAVPPV